MNKKKLIIINRNLRQIMYLKIEKEKKSYIVKSSRLQKKVF